MSQVLIVDDDPTVRFTLEEVLTHAGHAVLSAADGESGLSHLDQVDLVVTDLAMPKMDGLTFLKHVVQSAPGVPVIMVTARGSERTAVEAMRAGAYDYLTKPFDIDELSMTVARALETKALKKASRQLIAERAIGKPVIGQSPAFRRVLDAVERVAPRAVPVLVRGETGTGKELIASLLHAQSDRASSPLVRFNCAAIPADLAEAELFGHTEGAFTGATKDREGYFQRAHGGTLVLDELSELPLTIQPKLLRALQEGEIQPVGAPQIERVDVRVVACTNVDLNREVAEGRFRSDLYYRIAVVELELPPLSARTEDIADLVEVFLVRYRARFGLDEARLSPELMDALCRHPWPGNVRQLENTIARLLALSDGTLIGIEALEAPSEPGPPKAPGAFHERVAAFERQLIAEALAQTGDNQSEAARRLKMSRATLIDKMKRHGLYAPRSKREK